MHFDCIVVGGGIAGLLSAYKLSKQGKKVALVEKERLGGLIKSVSLKGFTLEQGAATLSASQELLALCNELGILNQLVYPNTQSYKQYVVYLNKIHQVPRNPWLLIKSNLFSFPEKIALVKGVFSRFPADYFPSGISIQDFLSEIFGKAVPEKLAAPVMRGIFGGDVRELKAQSVLNKLHSSFNSGYSLFEILRGKAPSFSKRGPICCLKGGNSLLTNTLESSLNSCATIIKDQVNDIHYDSNYSFFNINLNQQGTFQAKSVICATSGAASAQYLKGLNCKLSNFENINYAKIAVFHLAVKKPNTLPDNGFGVLFPSDSDYDLLGILYNSKIFPHVAPQGFDLITLCFGGSNIAKESSFTVEKYNSYIKDVLNRWLNIQDFEVLQSIAWPQAIPQYDNTAQALVKNQEELSARFPGLFFVGSDVGGVGVPARIERVISITSL